MSFITEADVREEMRDRTAADHLVLPDIAFSSEDIAHAMRKTARRFNSIRPYVMSVEAAKLPDHNNIFFDGIAWALLEGFNLNASMNDMDYTAGNVQASVQGKLVGNTDKLTTKYERRFVEDATAMKISTNLLGFYGQLG
jgi:hypothetical protein